ncbi:MAG: Polysialic acid transport protein KpsD precursor [Syntrophorhabdaceae bacterium PtaU1.Bin034]|nr:MAG: Polysialic acid transport protein KpsD precursor [Syntrophorhabdaceae bacterium PtaU1.Bin034]
MTTRSWCIGLLLILVGFIPPLQAQQLEVITIGPQPAGQRAQNSLQAAQRQQPAGYIQVPRKIQPAVASLPVSTVSAEEKDQRNDETERLSAFEKYVRQQVAESIGRETALAHSGGVKAGASKADETGKDMARQITQFGYDLFNRAPSTFAPVEQVPVGADYIIGPDDEIRVAVWGRVEGQWHVTVDRDGNMTLPEIGTIGVTGLTFRELKELLQREFSKRYTGYEMSVTMGSLRTIRVYIVGNARRPGSYTISSLATLVNALIEAGGPSKTGTMRDIQLNRKGKRLIHFDLYDLLLKGDKTKDVKLMPEDVIFIPPVGPLTAILGNVKNPGIYELKNEPRIADLIQMAGGLTGLAFRGRVQLQRIQEKQARTMLEGDLIDLAQDVEKNFALRDWDIVKLFDTPDSKHNVVRLSGAVGNQGEFAITPGITMVKDVIAKSGGALYYASDVCEITRVKVSQSGPMTERFTIDLKKASRDDPQHNVLLEINDYLFVRPVPDWQLYRTASISGEVKYPGVYTIRKGEKLSSLIERAGGYTDYAYLRGAVFTRERVKELQQKNLEDMVARLERELISESSTIKSGSTENIEARKIELQQKQNFIESLRKVKATGRLTISLVHLRLLKGSEYDIELENNDSLDIPTSNKVVNVVGAVMANTTVIHVDNTTPKDYIQMAGGYSRYADAKNTYLLKVDGSARRLSGGLISWNGSKERWELAGFRNEGMGIEPGDTIVVPEKLERIAWLREIKDITQIFANVAVAAGAVYLFSTR